MAERILIVEDEDGVRRLLHEMLTGAGYDVTAATSGEEAREAAELEPPDLVITDIGLPDIDGIELCRRLRERNLDLSFLIMTGRPEAGSAIEAMNLGIHDYLWKPFSMEEMKVCVERAFLVRRLRRELSAAYLDFVSFGELSGRLEEILLRGLDRAGFQINLHLGPVCRQIAEAMGRVGSDAGTALQARLDRLTAAARRLEDLQRAEREMDVNLEPIGMV